MATRNWPIGIDDMAFYTPKLYLEIADLAVERQISPEKLRDGLGLHKMSLPDAHEDAATMAAEALYELIERNQLDPKTIGRVWLGTESALDMSKPTATYAVGMVQERLAQRYGEGCMRHCDVLDVTFACIGATDALLSTLDWVSTDPDRIGIVIASDIAKYDLDSTGEYTQGAGAVAMLIKWRPRLITINSTAIGVATESVHDFFKPRRERYCETPVFDGQFSNKCYQLRMNEALAHFREKAIAHGLFKMHQFPAVSDRWARMIFHLPYAFHAKRIYTETFIEDRRAKGVWENDIKKYGFPHLETMRFESQVAYDKAWAGLLKVVANSAIYQRFINEKIEKSQRAGSETGNLYTASIFLALMSMLESDWRDEVELAGKRIGFVAYGSGSKSKVFEGKIGNDWKSVVSRFGIFNRLAARQKVDYSVYLNLHTGAQSQSIIPPQNGWALHKVEEREGSLLGARYYHLA